MMKRIQELIQENYETKIAQKEFEMKALQAQINPHFLYNSLSMINWKAIEAQETEISHITLTLSSFYRTTLNRGKTMTSIRNALDNIRAYLELQLYMHDNDFTVHYDVDESLYEYEIPLLIFQPFVENALEHGLDIKEDGDRQIWIQVGRNQEDISDQNP
ncbi:MAG: histidine kinase [Eubacterium sp.]